MTLAQRVFTVEWIINHDKGALSSGVLTPFAEIGGRSASPWETHENQWKCNGGQKVFFSLGEGSARQPTSTLDDFQGGLEGGQRASTVYALEGSCAQPYHWFWSLYIPYLTTGNNNTPSMAMEDQSGWWTRREHLSSEIFDFYSAGLISYFELLICSGERQRSNWWMQDFWGLGVGL